MLSPKLKQKVSNLWDMFWSGGMTNPLTSIEQITYLIFLKRLEEFDAERISEKKYSLYGRRPHCELDHHSKDKIGIDQSLPPDADPADYEKCQGHGTCRWSYLRRLSTTDDPETGRKITPYDHMNGYVFPWLRVLHNTLDSLSNGSNGTGVLDAPMEDAFFQFPKDKTTLFQNAIEMIDDLFNDISHASASDLMGDIFEYLLSEIDTSGKNGQFRTPRHIIRFLIELAQPEAGQRLIDPTAGTAGFLINTIQYLKKEFTSEENYLLEWDGTPHRTIGDKLPERLWNAALKGENFVGYDNDRTMVRIGWMNMILHGIENPHIVLRDTLGRSLSREESGSYNRVLANPPYTGTIDKNDLYLDIGRFPKNPRKVKEAITYKTELLFTWLILDLLVPGGRAAMIVPEGVLFGSTGAHKELRRQLLFDHNLQGVISLPAGVFNPYTGVKTSILVFEKGGDVTAKGQPPRTESVWFYDVTSDGYTPGAKREPDYTQNDLWDALYKWNEKIVDNTDYYQPDLYDARWRLVDEKLLEIFPERRDLRGLVGQELGIDELFGFPVPTDPKIIEQQVVEEQEPRIAMVYGRRLASTETRLAKEKHTQKIAYDAFDQDLKRLEQLFREAIDKLLENKKQFKTNPTFGRDRLQPLLETARNYSHENLQERAVQAASNAGLFARDLPLVPELDWAEEVYLIVREFAKLDGYDIKLRTLEVKKQEKPLNETKSWSAPVRVLLRNDEWSSADGRIEGSHDSYGNVRPAYLADPQLYEDEQNNIIKKEFLDPNCIEANDYNLSSGRYKPFKPTTVVYDPPAKLIRELQDLEAQIMTRLGNLLEMVEGRE
ncbi:MAG TPA: N-6 DNA methylase [Ktedonobacteraceae bacterium]|nr:N-6 DNA methylase [Ktedonobacteraceae bacterium]